ncbi:MAG: LysM peptidoglycan-binding domain-containing protein [Microthrixaceae bacterium]
MAAVIDLSTARHLPTPARNHRPELRVVPGGRSEQARRLRRTYLRRRLFVAGVALVVLLVAANVVATVMPAASGAGAVPVSSATYRVLPGDTLWSIAGQVAPGVDRRIAVDQLADLNGGTVLRAGQALRLPESFG